MTHRIQVSHDRARLKFYPPILLHLTDAYCVLSFHAILIEDVFQTINNLTIFDLCELQVTTHVPHTEDVDHDLAFESATVVP